MHLPRPGGQPSNGLLAALLALAAWLILAAVAAGVLWRERAQEVDKAKQMAAATTALLEAHTSNTFQLVSLALQDVASRLEGAPPARHDAALRTAMQARLQDMPYVRALFVIGPDGFIQHDTDYPHTPEVSLADRDYFRLHLLDPQQVRSISSPLLSRSGTGWFVAASRRIGDGSRFRGIVVAAIQLGYFSDLYQRMGLGPGHRISLFHRDGRLMARHPPEPERVGQTFADQPLFSSHMPQRPRGVYLASGDEVPPDRILSYHSVRGEPLVVGFSHDLDVVLASWHRMATAAAAGLLLLARALAGGVVLFLRAQADRARARERQAQGEKMEALGQLTGGIAHDIANLLGIVANNVELMRRSAGSPERTAVVLQRMQRAVDSGAAMTRQLMSFARKRELAVVEADLHEVVQGAMPLLEHAAGPGVRVRFEPAPAPAAVALDRAQLEVALINLVVNARDALHREGEVVLRTARVARKVGRWSWRGRRELAYVDLAVADDGPGMPRSVRDRAMEPFFTTKGEAGTGLGLAQVYGLMQQLGGELEIESAPGRGTTVHLLFPAL